MSVLPIVFICLFFIFAAAPDAHAASGYLADEIGNTEITVDVDETFYVVLWLVDVTELAGYDCAITISGPATATGTAAHGDWFADGHTVTQGGGPTATYTSAMLSNPTYISGSGDLVVFTLHADDDGVVAININQDIFCLGNDDAEEITITVPSTLYVTVGTGEGMRGGGEPDSIIAEQGEEGAEDSQSEEAESGEGGMELDEMAWTLTVVSDPIGGITIAGDPSGCGGQTGQETKYYEVSDLADEQEVTLTAPVYSGSYGFYRWIVDSEEMPIGDVSVTFTMTDDMTATAVFMSCVFVPSQEYPTIQDALDAADDEYPSAVILQTNYTYVGSRNTDLDFGGKPILLRSDAPEPVESITCVIDCQNLSRRAFKFHSGETELSVVYGIKMKRGCAPLDEDQNVSLSGGAILCLDSSPTIRACMIQDNYAESGGGGIAVYSSQEQSSAPLIDGCILYHNTSYSSGGGVSLRNYDEQGQQPGVSAASIIGCRFELNTASAHGGGVYANINGALQVQGTVFDVNHATNGMGGGITIAAALSIEMIGNFLQYNTASGSTGFGGGGYVHLYQGTFDFTGNCFLCNAASKSGGGLYLYLEEKDYSDDPFIGNTFTANESLATEEYAGGGGLVISGWNSAGAALSACMFEGNTALSIGGGIYALGPCSILSCTFNGNGTALQSKGGGVGVYNAKASITNSLFIHNVAQSGGGAHFWHLEQDATVTNCTFVDNTATDDAEDHGGGAIMCHDGGVEGVTTYIRNCIFHQNVCV